MADKIRVILFKEGDCWVAQGLEHDVCAQAASLEDLYGRFDVAVRLENNEEGGVDRIGPAPKYFFDLWDKKAGEYKPSHDGNPVFDFGMAA
jgi:hypothetical protein